MDEQGFAGNNMMEKRYDAVVHMVTAAEGAEEFYNYSNEARYENAESARARDHRLRQAYLGHNKYMIVDNETKSFEEKINKTMEMIKSVVGLPTDQSIFKKRSKTIKFDTGKTGRLDSIKRTEQTDFFETGAAAVKFT